jgi:hypothetical protein
MSFLPFYARKKSREERLYTFLGRLTLLHPFFIGVLCIFTLVLTDIEATRGNHFQLCQIIFLVPLPYVLCSVAGLMLRFKSPGTINKTQNTLPGNIKGLSINKEEETSRKYDRLFVCVVTKGVNKDAVYRTWETLSTLQDTTRGVYVYVVSDEPYFFDDLSNIVVPSSFECKNAKVNSK